MIIYKKHKLTQEREKKIPEPNLVAITILIFFGSTAPTATLHQEFQHTNLGGAVEIVVHPYRIGINSATLLSESEGSTCTIPRRGTDGSSGRS